MPMDTTETGRLRLALEHAAANLSFSLRMRADRGKILDHFRRLQDHLSKLIEGIEITDEHGPQCRSIIRKVIDILSSEQTVKLSQIPAIARWCDTINCSLIVLEQKTSRTVISAREKRLSRFATR